VQRTLLLILVGASHLLLAGGPVWSLTVLVVVAGAIAALTPRRTFGLAGRLTALDWCVLVGTMGVALQVLPLPRAIVGMLSPHADEVRRSLTLAPVAGTLQPITLDTRSTLVALTSLALAVLTYRAARATFDEHGGVRRSCRFLAWFGALAAVAAVAQRGAAPLLVLGLVPPEAAGARPFGAFVNRNHFAAWLLMAIPPVAGYLVAHLHQHVPARGHWRVTLRWLMRSRALPLTAALATMTGVLLMTLSRSALLGLGAAAAAWFAMTRRRLVGTERSWAIAIGAAGAAVLVAATLVDIDAWAARLESTLTPGRRPDDRLTIWRESLPVVRDFWPAGTGAGTYGVAMLHYQQSRIWVPHLAAWAHFNQAHNHYLQVLVEGGVLVAAPLIAGLVALAAAARRRLAEDRGDSFWIRTGAAAGLVGVAAQSLFEIPLTMPANAVLAAVLVAVLLHEPHAHPKTRRA
jgi:O-antigen ligase